METYIAMHSIRQHSVTRDNILLNHEEQLVVFTRQQEVSGEHDHETTESVQCTLSCNVSIKPFAEPQTVRLSRDPAQKAQQLYM